MGSASIVFSSMTDALSQWKATWTKRLAGRNVDATLVDELVADIKRVTSDQVQAEMQAEVSRTLGELKSSYQTHISELERQVANGAAGLASTQLHTHSAYSGSVSAPSQ